MSMMDMFSPDERRLMTLIGQGNWEFKHMPASNVKLGDVIMTGRSGCSAPIALINRDEKTVELLCGIERFGFPVDAEPMIGRRQPSV